MKLNLNNIIKGAGKTKDIQNKLIALFKKLVEFAKKLLKILLRIVHFFVTLITTPIGWLIIIGFVLALLFYSGTQTWGPQKFNINLQAEQDLELGNIEEGKQNEAISLHLANQGVSPEVSAYIAKKAKEGDFKAISGADKSVDKSCDTNCLLQKIKSGELDKNSLTLGAFKLKGNNAVELLEYAHTVGKEWTDKSTQINFISKKIVEASQENGSALKSSDKVLDGINKVNDIIGEANISGEKGLELTKELQTSAKKFKKKVSKARILGDGTRVGRVDGGGAGSGGKAGSASAGSVDATELIGFLESFCSGIKIPTFGGTGKDKATPEMLEAKRLAEEKGGVDSGGPDLYASCDRLVATALKATGIDPNMPWGDVQGMHNYVERHPELWQKVEPSERQSGDIIFWFVGVQWNHIGIYGVNSAGKQMIYQASWHDYLPLKTETNDNSYDPNYSGNVYEYWRFIGPKH